jgi:hypothetical protein
MNRVDFEQLVIFLRVGKKSNMYYNINRRIFLQGNTLDVDNLK